MAEPYVLEVEDLIKTYPKFLLDKVSFALPLGRVMGFVGQNGAGKTTTLKALMGNIHPDSGEVRFFGSDYHGREHEVRNRVSLSLGQVTFYPKKKLSVIADVYSRFFDSWDDKIFERYGERFDLVLSKKVDELSAGMRVKFGLALALSRNAELVILDEPTSGLDPLSRDDLLQDLRTLVDSEGLSLLFSTHQMTDLEQLADDITYLEQGRVRATEPLDSFLHRYLMIDAPTLSLSGQLREALVGATEVRDRTQAILPREFADLVSGLDASQPSLNDIIVHLEREEKRK